MSGEDETPDDRKLLEHLRSFFPGRRMETFSWNLGPVNETLPGFRVCRISPASKQDPWIYVSIGASRVKTPSGERLEFLLLSPVEEALHVETLAMVANFHADPRYALEPGRLIDIGQPWLEGSEHHHLLVSLPYPFGPELEHFGQGDGAVRFLWLLPVTEAESTYLRTAGLEALEEKFDEAEIDAIDPRRDSVV